MSHGPSLTVTNKTSLADLQNFSSQIGDNARLRGRQVSLSDGSKGIELYAKDSKPGLWSRLTGASSSKRSDAREAVSTVLRNHERSSGVKTLDNVRTALNVGIRSKDVKGEALKVLVLASDRAIQHGANGEMINAHRNPGPGLEKLPEETRRELAKAVSDFCGRVTADNVADETKNLSEEIGSIFEAASKDGTSKKILEKLLLSSGSAFKYDLREAGDPNITKNPHFLNATLDKIFSENETKLASNKQVADDKVDIGSEVYKKESFIAQGGFGQVYKYVSTSDPSRTIALKVMNSAYDDDGNADRNKINEFKLDARTHISALGDGSANIVGFRGAVGMSDGTLAIALDLAPNGTVEGAANKIKAAFESGKIDLTQARAMQLTLIKDMAEGLAHLQRAGVNMVHNDFKPANVLIGEQGNAMIADFGLSKKESKFDGANFELPDVHNQLSPEMYAARDAISTKKGDIGNENNSTSASEATARIVENRFKGLSDDSRKALLSRANAGNVFSELRNLVPDTQKAEIWSFGAAAFQVVYGRTVCELTKPGWGIDRSGTERRIAEFAGPAIDVSRLDSDPNRPNNWHGATVGAFAGSSGDPMIDNFLNSILTETPSDRPTISQIVNHDALKAEGVGSSETRMLLARLTS